jgi:ArsR family transcriptional regulator
MLDIIFKALSEESRLRILSILIRREMCVCEIEASLKMTQSNASRHLTVLKNSGILDCYKQGQWAYYKVSDQFKQENKELWEYLQIRLKQLKTYQEDSVESELIREKNICTNMILPK